MEIFTTIIENTNTPETQEILKSLDSSKDVLLTSENPEDSTIMDIQSIQPINQIKTLGNIPSSLMSEIRDKCGNNVNLEITDYEVTFDKGLYSLVVDIDVDNQKLVEVPKSRELPLPLLILVGIITGLLTIVLVIIKLIKGKKK